MRRYIPIAAAALGAAALAIPAFAGNGKGGSTGSTSSISIGAIDGVAMNAASPTSPSPKYEDTVTWATTVGSLAGWETPEVVLSCYQDVNGDGVVDTSLTGPDIVYSWIDSPSSVFTFGGLGQTSTWSLRGGGPATCRADLDAYGWKSGQSSVRALASTGTFAVSGS
jgi:hypothetical protein